MCACVAFNPPNAELDLSQNIKSRFCAVYLLCGVGIAHFALTRMMVARAARHPPGVSIGMLGAVFGKFVYSLPTNKRFLYCLFILTYLLFGSKF